MRRPVIYDCFIFFNEHDLLELRLRELDPVVDRFVVVEADTTHQGEPKPLYYAEAADRYRQWQHKIIHVVVDDTPADATPRGREDHQRNAIVRGLTDAKPDDVIIVADLDEIPRREVVERLDRDATEAVALEMVLHFLRFNLRSKTRWHYTKAVRRSQLREPNDLRMARTERLIPNAGWHFSYIGDVDFIRSKLTAFSHVEVANERFTSSVHIERSIRLGVDLFGREVLRVTGPEELPASLDGELLRGFVHPGRSRWQLVLAHGYRFVALNRRFLPNALTDRRPVLAFILAIPLTVMYRAAFTVRARRRARRSS